MKAILLAVLVGMVVLAGCSTTRSATVKDTPTPKATATKMPTLTPKPTNTAKPTETAKPIPTDTPVPSLTDRLAKLSKEQFGSRLKATDLTHVGGTTGDVATVDYELGGLWDESMMASAAAIDFVKFAPKVFELEGVGLLQLRSYTDFKDIYGKTSSAVAFNFRMSRKTVEKIDWKNVDRKRIGVALQLQGDSVYVHPALKAAWNKSQGN